MACGIYKITAPDGRVYIGMSKDINKRWYSYRAGMVNQQPAIMESILKYGSENHKFEILEECSPVDIRAYEAYYILIYKSIDPRIGLNCGGDYFDLIRFHGIKDLSNKADSISLIKSMMVLRLPKSTHRSEDERLKHGVFKNRKILINNLAFKRSSLEPYSALNSVINFLNQNNYSMAPVSYNKGVVGIKNGVCEVPDYRTMNDREIEKLDGYIRGKDFKYGIIIYLTIYK